MWTAHWEWFLAFFRSQTTWEHVCMPKNVLQDSSGTGKKSMLTPEAPHWIMSSFKTRVTGSFTSTQWVSIKLNPTGGASETVDFLSGVFLSQVYIWVLWLVSSYQEHVNFPFTLSFVLRLSHRPVMSWSADVSKGRWDRLLSPAKQTCRLKPTSSRRWWWSSQSTTYSCFLFWSHFIWDKVFIWDEVFEGAASTSDRENWVQQPGCKANKLQEWGLCCASHSLLAFEVNKQSGSWRKASCLAMWADTRRLPNLIGEEWGRKGITLSVRQYSVAALKDDRYSKSYIICWKCLHLRTLAERRSRSSCWPQPRSYITVFGTCLATFSSIKCNEIPQGFTNSVFHYRRSVAADKQAEILSEEFRSAQGGRTRVEMIATTCWLTRVQLWPLQAVLRVEGETEHTETIYACLICPPAIWQTLRSLDPLSFTEFPKGANFE